MKKIIFLLLFMASLFCVSTKMKAQNSNGTMYDNVVTTANADTTYIYPGAGIHGPAYAQSKTFPARGGLSHYIVIDSVSGSTNVKYRLQYSITTPLGVNNWYDKSGPTTLDLPVGGWPYKLLITDSDFQFIRFRWMFYTTGSTTQNTKLTDTWTYKQIY